MLGIFISKVRYTISYNNGEQVSNQDEWKCKFKYTVTVLKLTNGSESDVRVTKSEME